MNSTIIDRVEMNEEIKEQLRFEHDLESSEVKPERLLKLCNC